MKGFLNTLVSWGPAGVFLLAIADSVGVPSPGGMDVALLLFTIMRPDRAWQCAVCAIAGSLIGSMILFYLARRGGERYLERYTSKGRGARFKTWFLRYGLITVFIPALVIIPMPLKVFVICAGAMGVRPLPFLLVMAAARIPRYVGLAYLGRELGENSLSWLKTHAWYMAGAALLLFAILYLLARIADRQPRPGEE